MLEDSLKRLARGGTLTIDCQEGPPEKWTLQHIDWTGNQLAIGDESLESAISILAYLVEVRERMEDD